MKIYTKFLSAIMATTLLSACAVQREHPAENAIVNFSDKKTFSDGRERPYVDKNITYSFSLYKLERNVSFSDPSESCSVINATEPLYKGVFTTKPQRTVLYRSEVTNPYNKGIEEDVTRGIKSRKVITGEVNTGLTLTIDPSLNGPLIYSRVNVRVTHLRGFSEYKGVEMPKVNILSTQQGLLMRSGGTRFIAFSGFGADNSGGKYILELTAKVSPVTERQ